MSTAALLRDHPPGGYVPLVDLPVALGADVACAACDPAPGVAPRHATLSRTRGEYVLSAAEGLRVDAGGGPTPFLALRHGDVVRLAPDAAPWRVRLDTVQAEAPACDGAPSSHVRERAGGRRVCKCLGPLRDGAAARRHLRLLAALGGAPHPALACVADGGVRDRDGRPARWIETHWVDGTAAREAVEQGGMAVARVLPILRALARGLAHLHARGVVHRDVAPGNVILVGDGRAVLIDYGHAALPSEPPPPSGGVVGTPGYVAPEEVLGGEARARPAHDVYGWGAVGYALLCGTPPARGDDVLDVLARATRPPPSLAEMGVDAPPALERALAAALASDPAQRPGAADLVRTLEEARAPTGRGGLA